MSKSLTIIGPFITNYSLARVNRGLALALKEIKSDYKVHLYQDKERIDKWPDDNDLKKFPGVKKIWEKKKKESDVVIYNDFPKTGTDSLHGLKDLPGKIKLMYTAWEESVYPEKWVKEINENLHGVLVASSFVGKILKKNGVKLPIKVVLNAIDENMRRNQTGEFPLKSKKSFKFIHVSSARRRKGIDLLLKAYFEEFSADDDCVLVIKSFPGPENQVEELLNELKREGAPEVEHIFNPDISDQDLVNLNAMAHAGVYPTRAEGFGLPIAEAMYHDTPVITTNYSGHLDFADEDNAFLLDYELTDALDSEMVNLGAKWAEPDFEQLKRDMRELYEIYQIGGFDEEDIERLGNVGRETQLGEFGLSKKDIEMSEDEKVQDLKHKVRKAEITAGRLSWERSAKEVVSFIDKIRKIADLKTQNLAVISPINSRGGIAEYTKKLYSRIEHSFENLYYLANSDISDRDEDDSDSVVRNWEMGEERFAEVLEFVREKGVHHVHIQYHSGYFFSADALSNLIHNLKKLGKKVYVTLHAVKSDSFDYSKSVGNLKKADMIFTTNTADLEYLEKSFKHVSLLTLPIDSFEKRLNTKIKKQIGIEEHFPVIVSHGLFNSNKNIPSIIEAVNILRERYPEILFLGVNAVVANNAAAEGEYQKSIELIKKLGMSENAILVTDFLSDGQVEVFLQAGDINVLAYSDVGESASAAVRKCLASGNPTIVTDIKTFSEFRNEVYKIYSSEPKVIADGITNLMGRRERIQQSKDSSKEFVLRNSYDAKAVEMLERYK